MNRSVPTLILAIAFLAALAAGAAAAGPIAVVLDGKTLSFDQPPLMLGGRVMVPMRGIFEALGAEVKWDAATRTVEATSSSGVAIRLPLGARTAMVDGRPVTLDVPASTVGGRTVVPLRFVAEALGADVKWDGGARRVTIASAPATPAGPVAAVAVPRPGAITGTLRPTFRVTFVEAVRPESARMVVDTLDVTGRARITPHEASWTPDYDLSPGEHRVQVDALTEAGAPVRNDWSCRLNGGTATGTGIFSVQLAPARPLGRGDLLLVTVQAVPGGQATMQVGGRPEQGMAEAAPGVYVGTYRVQAGDQSDVAVAIRLAAPGGRVSQAVSDERAALQGGPPDVAGPAPAPPTPKPSPAAPPPPAPKPSPPPAAPPSAPPAVPAPEVGPAAFDAALDLPRIHVGNQAGFLKLMDRRRQRVDYFRTLDDWLTAPYSADQRTQIWAWLRVAPASVPQVARQVMGDYGRLPKMQSLALLGVAGSADPASVGAPLSASLQQFAVGRMNSEKDNVLRRQALLSLALMSTAAPSTVEAVLRFYETQDNLWVTFPVQMFFQYHADEIRASPKAQQIRARVGAVQSLYTPNILASLGAPSGELGVHRGAMLRLEPPASVTVLDMASRGLRQVPPESLEMTSLRQVSFRDNSLASLPDEIARLQGLRVLLLGGNQVRELPDSLAALPGLRHLDLSRNGLRELPRVLASLSGLQVLDLSDNGLRHVPPELTRMSSLKVLNLQGNQVSQLPSGMAAMTGLEVLDLQGNPLAPDQVEALRRSLPTTTILF